MGGVGLQQFFICCFVGLAIRFQRQMKRDAPITDQKRALRMLYILYAVLILITVSATLPIYTVANNETIKRLNKRKNNTKLTPPQVRIIFRLIEYSKGYNSGIPVHEAYQYVLDSTLMLVALVLFNIVHPGQIMPGKESDFPSRKQRKAVGKKNVKGRMAGGLPLYASDSDVQSAGMAEEGGRNPTEPKIDGVAASYGIVREFET